MLVLMKPDATREQQRAVEAYIRSLGFEPHPIPGAQQTAIGITGNKGAIDPEPFKMMDGVSDAIRVSKPFKLVSREMKPHDTVVEVAGVRLGGPDVVVIAGPCSVESREQILSASAAVKAAGAKMLRGGAFKPRTSPYDFQGLKEEGLSLLADARKKTGLPIVTEAKDTETLDAVAETADMLQIGARNMQNFSLLEAVGQLRKPVLLKRGMSATLEEWLMSAEYVMSGGNYKVILCERGVRTFADHSRNTLDLSVIPPAKAVSHLPIFVDPSHGTGKRPYVPAMALAGLAAGADGLLIEAHPDPDHALSDGAQSLDFPGLEKLLDQLRKLAAALGRQM